MQQNVEVDYLSAALTVVILQSHREDARSNRAQTETQISGPTLPLAIGKITRLDVLRVKLHSPDPARSPAFVLVIWPSEPSELSPNPQTIAAAASAVVKIMAAAQAELVVINWDRRW